jgi:hypothetical protein
VLWSCFSSFEDSKACELDPKHGCEDFIHTYKWLCYLSRVLKIEVCTSVTCVIVILREVSLPHLLKILDEGKISCFDHLLAL